VTFTYPRASRPTIQNLSLSIREGETVAIVGHNGAGKTTLAKLIARLYRADRGQILVDGVPIEEYALQTLYQQVAFVFQHATRYEATAGENIAYGDWRRLLDRPDEVVRIARSARVDEMVRRLPDGYETLLGRMFGDADLSGGQWQKLSIARGLACDPALVILDEPAANLDVQSEHAMYQAVHELIRDRTTILISHRFSTVGMADRIFVLDEGYLVEEGTHEELLACGGTYAAICRTHQATVSMKNRLFPSDLATGSTEVPLDCQTS
jgi:ATP-binding cassette subfamily B protein